MPSTLSMAMCAQRIHNRLEDSRLRKKLNEVEVRYLTRLLHTTAARYPPRQLCSSHPFHLRSLSHIFSSDPSVHQGVTLVVVMVLVVVVVVSTVQTV
ncbi:hypothetical protein E2C01_032254 [Portunus trituberculatus]|uniref:Uncharacterized protein n=1 Tax=Portunus trituberculatus TaxID=210409 RepID=A0A5B7EVJ9_PORTR|nr:hypothetical protein [Portunus trituberculatus]